MSFFDVFSSLCAKKGVSPSAAADEMGFSRSTVTAWKQGKTEPSLSIMQKMAESVHDTTTETHRSSYTHFL